MSHFDLTQTVGEVVARRPYLSPIFETLGIDFCCGGKKSLEQACRESGIDSNRLLARLSEAEAARTCESRGPNPAAMSLTELADHIEQAHHAYLCSELPRLDKLTEKVARVHGGKEPRLGEVRDTLLALKQELLSHMMKEERILFPMIRQLETSEKTPMFHCGSLSNPVRQMEFEHDSAGEALKRMRALTDDYQPPEWACNTYRAMLSALADLENDLHQHIHKENNVLFPRAERMELEKS